MLRILVVLLLATRATAYEAGAARSLCDAATTQEAFLAPAVDRHAAHRNFSRAEELVLRQIRGDVDAVPWRAPAPKGHADCSCLDRVATHWC